MFSCWHSPSHPNRCQMFFFFFFLRPEAQWLGETSRCCTNHQIIHTNWHHLMSRTTSSKRNYIHLNLSNPSAKETQKKKKKTVYLQFTANENRKDKSGTCASYYECTPFCVMSAACIAWGEKREGWNICPLYLYSSGGGKSKGCFSELNVNFFYIWTVYNHPFSCSFKLSDVWRFVTAKSGPVNKRKVQSDLWMEIKKPVMGVVLMLKYIRLCSCMLISLK